MHANSPLTVRGRMMLVDRIASGRPIAHVAAEWRLRKTATKWWRRFQDEGPAGLEDRSSRPRCCPHRTPARVELKILRLRRRRKLGPARISSIVDVPASTVHQVLTRAGMNRIAWMDRPTGRIIRRIHTDRPGQLVHVDVKKLGRIPPGGGWRMRGRDNVPHHSKTGSDTTTSTRRSTLTPGWPTPRSTPMSEDRPVQASGSGPRPSSPTTMSGSRRCCR